MKLHAELKKEIENALYGEQGVYTQLLAYIRAYNQKITKRLGAIELKGQGLTDVLILCCGAVGEMPQNGHKRYLPQLIDKLSCHPDLSHARLLVSIERLNDLINHRLLKISQPKDSGLHSQFIKEIESLKRRADLKSLFKFINNIIVAYTITDSFDGPDEAFRETLDRLLNNRNRQSPVPEINSSPIPFPRTVSSSSFLSGLTDTEDFSVGDQPDLLDRIKKLEEENERLQAELKQSKSPSPAVVIEAIPEAQMPAPAAIVDAPISIKDLCDLYRIEEGFLPIAHFDANGDFKMATDRLKPLLTALDPQGSDLIYKDIEAANFKVLNFLISFNHTINSFAARNNQILFLGKFKRVFTEWQNAYAEQLQAYLLREPKAPVEVVIAPTEVDSSEVVSVFVADTAAEKRRNLQHLLELFLEPSFLQAHLESEAQKTVNDKEAYIPTNDIEDYAKAARDRDSLPIATFDSEGKFFLDTKRLYDYVDGLHLKAEHEHKKEFFKEKVRALQADFEKNADISDYLNKLVMALRSVIASYMENHDAVLVFSMVLQGARSAWKNKHDALLESYQKTHGKAEVQTKSSSILRPSNRVGLVKPDSTVKEPVVEDPGQAVMKSAVQGVYRSLRIELGSLIINSAQLLEKLTEIAGMNPNGDAMDGSVTQLLEPLSRAVTSVDKLMVFKKFLDDVFKNHPEKASLARYLSGEYSLWWQKHRVALVVDGLCHLALANRFVPGVDDAQKIDLLKPYMMFLEEPASDMACLKLFNNLADALQALPDSSVMPIIESVRDVIYQGFDSNASLNGTEQKWLKKAQLKAEFNIGIACFRPDEQVVKPLRISPVQSVPSSVDQPHAVLGDGQVKLSVKTSRLSVHGAKPSNLESTRATEATLTHQMQTTDALLKCFVFKKGGVTLHEKALVEKLIQMDPLQNAAEIRAAIAGAMTVIEKIAQFKAIMVSFLQRQPRESSFSTIFDAKYKEWMQAHRIELAVEGLCGLALTHPCRTTSRGQKKTDSEKEALLKRHMGESFSLFKGTSLTLYDALESGLSTIPQEDRGAIISHVAEKIDQVFKKDKGLDKRSKDSLRATFKTAFGHYQASKMTPVDSCRHPESSTEKNDELPHDAAHEVNGRQLHDLQSVLTVQQYLALLAKPLVS